MEREKLLKMIEIGEKVFGKKVFDETLTYIQIRRKLEELDNSGSV